MSLRPKESINNVLCPSLTGVHYLTITGAHGYGRGILARTLKGMRHTAFRLAVKEGFDRVLQTPAKIRIVSPSSEDVDLFSRSWDRVFSSMVVDAVTWRLESLLRHRGKLPKEFVEIRTEKPTVTGSIVVSFGYSDEERHFQWVGKEDFVTRFSHAINDREMGKIEGMPSAACTHKPGRDLWFFRRGWKSEVGTTPGYGGLTLSDGTYDGFYGIAQETPAFFYEEIEKMPKALDPVWDSLRAYLKKEKAIEAAKRKEWRAEVRKQDRAELQKLRDFFRLKP